ncbi:MAG: hypothetical protein JF616_02380 [Fibrobacteres bacterium]|nr:hypothetical protein [Fibrobacterota bacterium]
MAEDAAASKPVDHAAARQAPAPAKDSLKTPEASPAPDMAALQDPLLPAIMSPGEKLMWGKNGLMRKIGAFPLTEESREKEMSLRRTMLTVHEIGGFITLASMLTTVVYGQLTLNGNLSLGETHQAWATATIISYFTTASLSLLSPPPMVRRNEWNTVSIHKGLAIIHFTGMILTPLLADGIAQEERGSSSPAKINRDKAHIHQISGYITTATFAAAMMVITF